MQAKEIRHKMQRYDIENDANVRLMAAVNQLHQTVGIAVARSCGKITGCLIAPRAVKRVFGQRHQLNVREALLLDIGNELVGKLPIGEHSAVFLFLRRSIRGDVLGIPPPRTGVQLINAHGTRIVLVALCHPILVVPVIVVDVKNSGCIARPQFGMKSEWVGAVNHAAFLRGCAVFIQCSLRNIFAENGPDSMGLVLHVPTVPVVKIADQLHVDGVRRIDTELDAVLTVFVDRVRAENLICLGALSG